jgi:hypothetical protein
MRKFSAATAGAANIFETRRNTGNLIAARCGATAFCDLPLECFDAATESKAEAHTAGRSRVKTEIKKKIRGSRKISCEFFSGAFISSVFGGFTSNVVFDFLWFEAFRRNPNSHDRGFDHGCKEKSEEESC